MPKVSIIIPVYNVERYIDKCVQSAKNQTLDDIEIILVDDQSPDSCPQMCDEYAAQDSRIKVVHKKNGGLGFARNSGLEVATGEYVTFLDSDDFVDLCTYAHLYDIAKKEDLDAIYYRFKRFTDENEVTPEEPSREITKYDHENIKELMLDIIASEPSAKVDNKVPCSSCTAMYRLDVIKKNGIRFHSERELICEDLIFNLDLLKHAETVASYNRCHYHYRINPASLTGNVRTDRFEKDHIQYNYIRKNIKDWGLDEKRSEERCFRFFIGNSRTSISQYLNSGASLNEKIKWTKGVLAEDMWQKVYKFYNWRVLPPYQKIFLKLCIKKRIGLLLLLCKIVSIIKK